MIAYVMLYSVAVGAPIVLSALVVSAVLRRYGRAERFVWLGALLLAIGLPVVAFLRPAAVVPGAIGDAGAGASTGIIGLPTVFVVPDGPAGFTVGAVLVAAWLIASLLLLARTAVAAFRLARARGSWRASTLDGVPVWMTPRTGPAVAGIVRPRVLVPEWLARLPGHQRSLVLLHEQEHIRAGDPWLMAISRVAPIVAPWNPVLWILSARLLRAIELDCDRRVLRQRPDVRAYGSTLIEVSTRDSDRLVAVAAFAESEAPLRTRILSMTTPPRTVSVVALLTSMVLGVTLVVVAFQVPVPAVGAASQGTPAAGPSPEEEAMARTFGRVRPEPVQQPERPEVRVEPVPVPEPPLVAPLGPPEPLESATGTEPVFTPFTRAPQLLNLREVRAALVEKYPTVLRDSGIGGRVTVWFHIDGEGRVTHTRIDQSSGFEALDQAALNVAGIYRFSPALNRDQRVPVWVSLPIAFQPR